MHTEIVNRLIKIIEDNLVFEEGINLSLETDLVKIGNLDSIDIVSLGIEIQDEFGIDVQPEEFSGESITIKMLVDLIEGKLDNK